MKAIFGFLSILIALAIVASIAKHQLRAVGATGGESSLTTRANDAASQATAAAADTGARGDRDGATLAIPGGMPGAVAADPNGDTVAVQARNIENRARDNTVRALQQGMKRNERAEP